MIKRTLYFLNPCSIFVKTSQLKIQNKNTGEETSIPIEDVGVVVLENTEIDISSFALNSLLENNVAVITCNQTHYPSGLFLPLTGNHIQQEIFTNQINSTQQLKNKLWKDTIYSKILNQSLLLKLQNKPINTLKTLLKNIKTGDSTNRESVASVYYWKNLFSSSFIRDRYGLPPNNLLNYGYAILRASVSRSLVASGLLPTLGIHHHNRYNQYCLADDIMEPYRPFVDKLVTEIFSNDNTITELTTDLKKKLLIIPTIEVTFENEKFPLLIGLQRTTASLAKCFNSEEKEINYPLLYGFKRL